MITDLSHTTIWVLDQDEALEFYTGKLGFEVNTDATMDEFRWLTVNPPDRPEHELGGQRGNRALRRARGGRGLHRRGRGRRPRARGAPARRGNRAQLVPVPRDSKVEKWERDLDRIKNEVVSIYHVRAVYRQVGQIVDDNDDLPPSLFFDYLTTTYAHAQGVAVRRQAEVSSRVVSLGSLLDDLAAEPDRLTRERYVTRDIESDRDDSGIERLANEAFDRLFAGEVGEHLDPKIAEADLGALQGEAETIKRWTDRILGHADRDAPPTLPTFDELNAAIDLIGELFRKYAVLLTGVDWGKLEPVMHNWLGVFTQPWLKR